MSLNQVQDQRILITSTQPFSLELSFSLPFHSPSLAFSFFSFFPFLTPSYTFHALDSFFPLFFYIGIHCFKGYSIIFPLYYIPSDCETDTLLAVLEGQLPSFLFHHHLIPFALKFVVTGSHTHGNGVVWGKMIQKYIVIWRQNQ